MSHKLSYMYHIRVIRTYMYHMYLLRNIMYDTNEFSGREDNRRKGRGDRVQVGGSTGGREYEEGQREGGREGAREGREHLSGYNMSVILHARPKSATFPMK